jgi:hypothetical protein
VGDGVGLATQLRVGPAQPGRDDAGAIAPAALERSIEQLDPAIELRREAQLRQLEQVLGLRLERRQAVAAEGVDVGGAAVGHGAFLNLSTIRAR